MRIRNLFIWIALLLLSASALAADAPPSFKPPRTVGATATLTFTKTRYSETNGKTSAPMMSKSRVTATVIEVKPKETVFQWRLSNTELISPARVPDNTRALLKMADDLSMELVLAEDGTVQIRNMTQLIAATRKLIKSSFNEVGAKGENERAAVKLSMDAIERLISNPKDAQAVFTREPSIYFGAYSIFPNGAEQRELTITLPGFESITTEPVEGKATIAVTRKPTPEDPRARIEVKCVLDENSVQRFAQGLFRSFTGRREVPDQLPEMSISDRTVIVVNTQTGWVESSVFRRVTQMGNERRVDERSFELISTSTTKPSTGPS